MDSIPDVIGALERAPGIVIPLVREVPPAFMRRRPTPGKWSAHEHACHLAVVHQLFLDRLEQMLDQPDPVINPYDPGPQNPDDALLKIDLSNFSNEAIVPRSVDRVSALASRRKRCDGGVADHAIRSHVVTIPSPVR